VERLEEVDPEAYAGEAVGAEGEEKIKCEGSL